MDLNNLIAQIYALKLSKEYCEAKIQELKSEISKYEKEIEEKSALLLSEFPSGGENLIQTPDELIASKQVAVSFQYHNESDAIATLQKSGYNNLIKSKLTESLDKNAIKKAAKIDAKLAEIVESLSEKVCTEYLVVTTKEKYETLLEHINNGK